MIDHCQHTPCDCCDIPCYDDASVTVDGVGRFCVEHSADYIHSERIAHSRFMAAGWKRLAKKRPDIDQAAMDAWARASVIGPRNNRRPWR